MKGSRWVRCQLVVILACVAGPLSACDDRSAPPPATSPNAEASTQSSAEPSAACVRAERRAVENLWLWETIDDITNFPTAAARVQAGLHDRAVRTGKHLAGACSGATPPGFAQFQAEVDRVSVAARLGAPQLDRLLTAWLRWGEAAGAPTAARREIDGLEACRRRFLPRFDAAYTIRSAVTATGRVWWVELTFHNRTGKLLDGDMGGTARVDHMLPDPFGWDHGPRPGPGKDAVLHWGGSSADGLELQPGTTEVTAAPDIDQDVHTTAEGAFHVVDLDLYLSPRRDQLSCTPPIRPAH